MSAPSKSQLLARCATPVTWAEITQWSNANQWIYKRTREAIEDLISAGYLKRIPKGVVSADYEAPEEPEQVNEDDQGADDHKESPAPVPPPVQAKPQKQLRSSRPATAKKITSRALTDAAVTYLLKSGGRARPEDLQRAMGATRNQMVFVCKKLIRAGVLVIEGRTRAVVWALRAWDVPVIRDAPQAEPEVSPARQPPLAADPEPIEDHPHAQPSVPSSFKPTLTGLVSVALLSMRPDQILVIKTGLVFVGTKDAVREWLGEVA